MMRSTVIPALMLLVLAVLVRGLGAQQVLNVPSVSHPTIQSAINAAANGDTILVAAGTYYENLVWGSADLTIQGAGPGQSIIDGSSVDSCLTIWNTGNGFDPTIASTFAGFTLRNGKGKVFNWVFGNEVGGGGIFFRPAFGPAAPTFRDLEITNCTAVFGAAIYGKYCHSSFERIHVHGNSQFNNGTVGPGGGIVAFEQASYPKIRDSVFENNVSMNQPMMAGRTLAPTSCEIEDCRFLDNVCPGQPLVTFGDVTAALTVFRRCVVAGNQCPGASGIFGGAGLQSICEDSLFVGNTGGGLVVGFAAYQTSSSFSRVRNVTIADNVLDAGATNVFGAGSTRLENSIVWNNTDALGSALATHTPYVPPAPIPPTSMIRFHSCLQDGGSGIGVISSDPMFVDPANGDYRLLPNSPCFEAGNAAQASGVSMKDLDGWPRIAGLEVDMGCYEAHSLAHDPASASRVGAASPGGPFDILRINGSTGGALRRLSVPVGSASSVEMLQPPHLASAAKFVIFGFLGEADVNSSVTVPLGIGPMSFAPSPMVPPFFQWLFFTYTDNFNPANAQFVGSTPTPWNSGLGPAIPFPLTISFQGVIEEAPGLFSATNAIVLEVE